MALPQQTDSRTRSTIQSPGDRERDVRHYRRRRVEQLHAGTPDSVDRSVATRGQRISSHEHTGWSLIGPGQILVAGSLQEPDERVKVQSGADGPLLWFVLDDSSLVEPG